MTAKTYTLREAEIERRWYVVDATDETLGRLASRIARVLVGKHKPTYTPNLDGGDHVIVLNAGKVVMMEDVDGLREVVAGCPVPVVIARVTLVVPVVGLPPASSGRATTLTPCIPRPFSKLTVP